MEKMKWIKKGIRVLLALNMILSSVPSEALRNTKIGSVKLTIE